MFCEVGSTLCLTREDKNKNKGPSFTASQVLSGEATKQQKQLYLHQSKDNVRTKRPRLDSP